jgi:hypothetical protein
MQGYQMSQTFKETHSLPQHTYPGLEVAQRHDQVGPVRPEDAHGKHGDGSYTSSHLIGDSQPRQFLGVKTPRSSNLAHLRESIRLSHQREKNLYHVSIVSAR